MNSNDASNAIDSTTSFEKLYEFEAGAIDRS